MLDKFNFNYFLKRQGSLRFFFSLLQDHQSPAYVKKTNLKEQLYSHHLWEIYKRITQGSQDPSDDLMAPMPLVIYPCIAKGLRNVNSIIGHNLFDATEKRYLKVLEKLFEVIKTTCRDRCRKTH